MFGVTPCLRLSQADRRAGLNMLTGYGVTAENISGPHRAHIKRHVVDLSRTWPLYFSRLFPVSGATQVRAVYYMRVKYSCNSCDVIVIRCTATSCVTLGSTFGEARHG